MNTGWWALKNNRFVQCYLELAQDFVFKPLLNPFRSAISLFHVSLLSSVHCAVARPSWFKLSCVAFASLAVHGLRLRGQVFSGFALLAGRLGIRGHLGVSVLAGLAFAVSW